MKILDFKAYCEKLNANSISLDDLKDVVIDMDNDLVKPGDSLEDGDMVFVACEKIKGVSDIIIRCGVYRTQYAVDDIHYADNTSLMFNEIKQDYEYTYKDTYTHYILKVYRPTDEIHRIKPLKNNKIFIEKVESSPFYKCIYKNEKLCDRFGV